MALTASIDTIERPGAINKGDRRLQLVHGTLTFDSSYPFGGEALPSNFPLTTIKGMKIENKSGHVFEFDYANKKVLVKRKKPLLVVEEVVTVASNAGTLKHLPLYIAAVQVTAGTTTGAFKVIPKGETPLTTQVAVDFTTGGLTFLGTDAVTSAKVTYLPKQDNGYLSSVTVDETVTASASKADLAARAALVQYVWDDTDGVLCTLEPSGEAPSATHKAVVDINDSGDTSIDSHADDATNTLKVTYVPYDQIPADCFIDDTDVALSSEAYNFDADGGYRALIVPGLGCVLVGETGAAANQEAVWEGPSGTAANNVAKWDPKLNYILTDQTTAMATTAIPWLVLDPLQIGEGFGEAPNGEDLSALTGVTFLAWGW